MRVVLLGIVTSLLFAGCTLMPDVKVIGVDNLKVTEHKVSQVEATVTCTKLMGLPTVAAFLVTPIACARIYLEEWTCDIYYSELTAWLSLEHERLHCKGYWHDDGLQKYYDRWKAEGKAAG